MIHLTLDGLSGTLTDADAQALREEFARQHCTRLRGLLDAGMVRMLQRYVDEMPFVHRVHGSIGTEYCLPDGRAVRLMFFLVNDPSLFEVIDRITGCGRIGCFTGRIYRMLPGSEDYDTWHSDVLHSRLIGMSVNLGGAYEGGVFQLRDKASKRILCEAPNVVAGDAILFRIDGALQHWITPMAGSEPKTAFAGWFRRSPEFLDLAERSDMEIVEPEW